MRHLLKAEGIDGQLELDSCGTIGLHHGNPPDSRMTAAARARGIPSLGSARQICKEDLDEFDLVLAMDEDNFRDIRALGEGSASVRKFCEFCTRHDHTDVPDPYYGGADGFELVLDLLEDGCSEIIRQLRVGELP